MISDEVLKYRNGLGLVMPQRYDRIKRRTNVVGIFPNNASIRRLVGALMLEQNDEWAVTRRYMTLETVAAICEDQAMDPAKIAAL